MPDQIIKIPTLNDSEIIKFIQTTQIIEDERYKPTKVHIHLIGSFNKEYNITDLDKDQTIQIIINKVYRTIISFSINFTPSSFAISYNRGGSDHQSPVYDDIRIIWNDQQNPISESTRLIILDMIFSHLSGVLPQYITNNVDIISGRANIDVEFSKEIVRQTQAMGLKFSEKIVELEKQMGNILIEKSYELNRQHSERLNLLETEYKEKYDELTKRADALVVQQQEFDAREPRHMRRQLRSDLLSEIKS